MPNRRLQTLELYDLSMKTTYFSTGDSIFMREILNGKVWTSRPVTVVVDNENQTVTWLAPGTLIDYPIDVEHGEICFNMWLSGKWSLEKREFKSPGLLRIAPANANFEIFASVPEEGGVQSGYVNFQRPLKRLVDGFATMDETLDLIVDKDLENWVRRDEDELELALKMGVYTEDEVSRILGNCIEVESKLSLGEIPWDISWNNWIPPKNFG